MLHNITAYFIRQYWGWGFNTIGKPDSHFSLLYELKVVPADSGGLVSTRHLATVFAVVRDPGETQWLTLEFMDGSKLNYMCKTREVNCILQQIQCTGSQ